MEEPKLVKETLAYKKVMELSRSPRKGPPLQGNYRMKEPKFFKDTQTYKKVREAEEQRRSLDQHVMDATRNALAQRFAGGFAEDVPDERDDLAQKNAGNVSEKRDLPPYPTKSSSSRSRRRRKSLGRRHSFDPRSEKGRRNKTIDRRCSTTDLDDRNSPSSGNSSEDSYPRSARCRRSKSLRRRNSTTEVERARGAPRRSQSRKGSGKYGALQQQDSLQDPLTLAEVYGPCDYQAMASSLCIMPQPLMRSVQGDSGEHCAPQRQDSLQDTLTVMETNAPCDYQAMASSLCLVPQPLQYSFEWLLYSRPPIQDAPR